MEATGSNSNIRVLAVEDDPIYAESLELTLGELGYRNFSIVDNAAEALKIFKDQKPDVVLADIEINGPINGIEMVEIMSNIHAVPVVYVTAFTDPATFIEAKRTRPSAYIVKPYHTTNLQAAIELALQNLYGKKTEESRRENGEVVVADDAIFVKYNSKLFKVRIPEILYIEVEEKYCLIQTGDKRFAVNIRLKNLLEQLPPTAFVQVHRSFAVKVDAVEEVNLEEGMLKIGRKEIPIGKTYKDVFFGRLKML